jgi:hypothetical protein
MRLPFKGDRLTWMIVEDLDFCKSRIYKNRKKNKRVSENTGDNL